jgi:hypothetical protein
MNKLLLTGIVSIGTILTGCASSGGYVSARFGPPPPPRYGAIGVAPGPGYIWADGFWDLRGGRWVWAPGRWTRPPRGRRVWVAPQWREDHGRYHYHRGEWRM